MKPIISLSLNLLKYSQTMSYNPYSLEGKTIFVTGASSGIGQSTAIECSKLGAKLIITGRNIERLQRTFDLLEGEGHIQIAGDLTVEEEMNTIVDSLPKLDGFVNNAGIGNTLPVQFTTKKVIDKVFQTNLVAPVLLTSVLLKRKLFNRGASLVLTSSIAVFIILWEIVLMECQNLELKAFQSMSQGSLRGNKYDVILYILG